MVRPLHSSAVTAIHAEATAVVDDRKCVKNRTQAKVRSIIRSFDLRERGDAAYSGDCCLFIEWKAT